MAYDLLDYFAGAMGRPDPRQQLYNSLGQGPAQAGSPQGPQPLAGGPGAPNAGGGPPGAAPGAAAAPAGPQVYQSPPDLATAYTALAGGGNAPPPANAPPPDLAQMFMAYQQREQAKQGFWSGLAGVAQALHPGRVTPGMVKSITGQGEDAGSLFQNFMQMQQWQQQNQALQAYRQGVPGMLKGFGLTDEEVKAYTPLALADPSFATKLAETKLGVGGGPAWMAQMHAEKALTDAGKPIPWTPGDPSSYNAWTLANTGQAVTTAKTKADDLVADQRNFGPALQNYDKTIGIVDQLMQPDMKKAAEEFLGRGGQVKIDYGALSDPAKKAYQLYKNLMASQFTAGTQDFKGAGRITNQMLTQDAPSQSTMGINQAPKDFFDAVGQYRQNLTGHRALLFGPAQKADDPRLSDEDYARYVHPNMDLYGGKGRDIPDFSKMNAADADKAYEALPSGQNKVFIDTDGQPKRKP